MLFAVFTYAQKINMKTRMVLPKEQTTQVKNNQITSLENGEMVQIAKRITKAPATTARKVRRAEETQVTPPSGAESTAYIIEGKYYNYNSSAKDFVLAENFSPADGAIVINGNDIYIQGLAHWFPNAWVKGTIDGNAITIPSFQYLGTDDIGDEYLCGNNLEGTEEKAIVFSYDSESGILTLDANTRIEEVDENKNQFGYWQELTMTPGKIERPEVVTPPAGLETTAWDLTATKVSNNGNSSISSTVYVGISGNEIYIQGIDNTYLVDAWIKGTINGTKATFTAGQYLGSFYGYDMYFVGTDGTSITDVVFTYDNEKQKLTLDNGYVCSNSNTTTLKYYLCFSDITITKQIPLEPVVPPTDLETKDFPLSGKVNSTKTDLTGNVKVGKKDNDVYVQGLVVNYPEAWVKGTITGDKVSFPIQYVGKDTNNKNNFITGYSDSEMAPFVLFYDEETDTYEADGTLILNSDNKNLSLTTIIEQYTGVFLGKRPDLVTVPSDLETIELPFKGKNSNDESVLGTVKVGIDGNDVYIQGLSTYTPEGWIKGNFNEDKTMVTFPSGQYLGMDNDGWNYYLLGGKDSETGESVTIDNVYFTYDQEFNYFELKNTLYINARRNIIYYYDCLQKGLTINTKADATWVAEKDESLEDGNTVETIIIDDYTTATLQKAEGTNSPTYYENSSNVQLYAGNTLTINSSKDIEKVVFYMNGDNDNENDLSTETGQYVYENATGTWTGEGKTIMFSIPNENGHEAHIQKIDIFYIDYSVHTVEVPEDLTTETYKFIGTDYNYFGEEETVTRDVQVGFYNGNEVYIQGLSSYMSDAWVKGVLVDGILTIPNWFLGNYDYYGDLYKMSFGGATFSYDEEADQFSTEENLQILVDGSLAEEYFNVTITKIMEKAGTPAQPEITSFNSLSTYGYIEITVPDTDTEGNLMLTDKLSYQLYIDIEGNVSELTFPASIYSYLDNDMTVIPFNFDDDYDFFSASDSKTIYIYPNDMNSDTWNKIGVKSIYTGGDETHESEINWYTIMEYTGIEGIKADNKSEKRYYNLNGMRVDTPRQKGVYIVNGRKVVISK